MAFMDADNDITIDPSTMPGECIVRTARKPWRCVCAEPLRCYRLCHETTCGGGWSHRDRHLNREALEAEAAAKLGTVSNRNIATGEATGWVTKAWVEEVPNPEYRPDCPGDIAPGDRYVEYVGEACMWESGTRYCARCAVGVWSTQTGGRADG